jgi:hypothetical protein
MNEILHCPSGQRGTIVGYHHGRRYFMVKTDTGQRQNWTKSSSRILKEDYMTTKILLKLSGGPSKLYNVIERIFNTVEEAAEYMAELTRINGALLETDRTGELGKMSGGWTLECNYDLREIIKKVPPEKDLWDWHPFDLQKKLAKNTPMPYKPTQESRTVDEIATTPSSKKIPSGKIVKLQDLTKDGRAARVILRDLVRKKKIVKNGRWEWEEGSPDLEIVRAAIAKGANKE